MADCRLELLHAGKNSWSGPMFMELFIVAAWGIWKERNDKHFRGVQPTLRSWKARFKSDFAMLVHRAKPESAPYILSLVAAL